MDKFRKSSDDYLEAIYVLSQKRETPIRNTHIASFLQYKAPSVSRAVAVLKKDGYLEDDEASGISLTESGKQRGKHTYEKGRFFLHLLSWAGVDADHAKMCANKLKHDVSEECYERLYEALYAEAKLGEQGLGVADREMEKEAVIKNDDLPFVMTAEQWRAIRDHDAKMDGVFVYALSHTKVFCRPSCRAHKCSPDRVIIFETAEQAIENGYSPCKRCRPDKNVWKGNREDLARLAAEHIDQNYREKFSLQELAGTLHVDPSYLERTFHEIVGQTLLVFHNSIRCEQACKLLQSPQLSVTDVSYQVGFTSSAHFTRVFRKLKGCTPSEYRSSFFKRFESESAERESAE